MTGFQPSALVSCQNRADAILRCRHSTENSEEPKLLRYPLELALRLQNETSSLFGQSRLQIELKMNAAGEVVTALVQSPTPFRTRALKKPTRKRPSSVDCQN